MLHIPTLLRKLQKLGITGNTAHWIENFLSNRTFQVKVGAELSNKFFQLNGTPQGSVISPLLLLVMINNIPSGPDGVDMSLFADDSAVYSGCRNIKFLRNKIQQTIDLIHCWCNENCFKISINKTTGVLFTNKRHVPDIKIKVGDELIKMENKVKFLGIIFDRKLNWKPHVDYIVDKCKKRLNLMRAVSGYHWGASKKSLLAIYKALIRSILDYGDVAFSSASKSILNKLISIQSEALRLCCGASKGTSTSALQNECGELPLNLRRLNNSIKLQTKIMGNKDHPCTEVTKPHWTNLIKTTQYNQQDIYNRTQEFTCTLDNTIYLGPCFSSFPPWQNNNIDIDISLSKTINKKLDNPEYLKLMALQLLSIYNTQTHIYTDGSKIENNVSAAFTIPSMNIDKKFKLCHHSSIYAAEMTAIKEVVSWIIDNDRGPECSYAIFSDSLSVLSSLKEGICKSRPNLFNELLDLLNKLLPNKVKFIWIPSHVDISGNERADKLAKEALEIEDVNSTNYLETDEIKTLIKPYIINKWQTEYNNNNKGYLYKSICPDVSTLIKFTDPCRHKEVQISRLRLGVALTNHRLYRIGRHPDGLCSLCQTPDTIQHLLLQCKKHNISTLLKDQCAIYKLEPNLRNILDIGCIQTVVYRLVKQINEDKVL